MLLFFSFFFKYKVRRPTSQVEKGDIYMCNINIYHETTVTLCFTMNLLSKGFCHYCLVFLSYKHGLHFQF